MMGKRTAGSNPAFFYQSPSSLLGLAELDLICKAPPHGIQTISRCRRVRRYLGRLTVLGESVLPSVNVADR